MELNKIYNEDCLITLDRFDDNSISTVLTSPPYNNCKITQNQRAINNYENRYDIYIDKKSDMEYAQWVASIFQKFNRVLTKNGVVIWNTSYGSDGDCNNSIWLSVAEILKETPFVIAEKIVWKKDSALPNNVSPNKLTRICEDVFVFVRQSDYKTHNCNKKLSGISKTGQKNYENIFNYVHAPNNDGPNPYNKATYSTSLCSQLLGIYAVGGGIVYDPFMGTGTTAVACKKMGFPYVGSELSKNQYDYANSRLGNTAYEPSLF